MGIGALNYQGVKSGLKLNDVIEEFKYVYQGQEIKAGDFVNYINGVAGEIDYGTSVDTQISTSGHISISAVLLPDGKVFIAHGQSYLYGVVVTVEGATITVGASTLIDSTSRTGATTSAVVLPNENVFIAYSYSSSNTLRGIVCTINGTTITAGTYKSLTSSSYAGSVISPVVLPNGNVFVTHSNTSSMDLYGMVVTMDGTTITEGTDTELGASAAVTPGKTISAKLLDDGNVFIAHSRSDTYLLFGMIASANGTTITTVDDVTIIGSNDDVYRPAYVMSIELLDNGNVFVAHHGTSEYLYGTVVTINGTTLTAGVTTNLSTKVASGRVISTTKLKDGRVFVAHNYDSYYKLAGVIVTIDGEIITPSTDIELTSDNNSGYFISCLLLQNGTIFIAHSHNYSTSSYYLYAQLFGIDEANNVPTNNVLAAEYEQQVKLATQPPFNGIALSNGVGGTATAHNEQVKIARPNA